MEDFLELAKDNTDKDLETCGILGAFLVRFVLSHTFGGCVCFLSYWCCKQHDWAVFVWEVVFFLIVLQT